jgi:hypothetical protein
MTLARLFPLLLLLLLISLFMGLFVILGAALFPLIMLLVQTGPVLVLWTMGMALAGAGNRLAWSSMFFVMTWLGFVAFRVLSQYASSVQSGIVIGILALAAIPVLPAFLLWTAHAYGRWRRPKKKMP